MSEDPQRPAVDLGKQSGDQRGAGSPPDSAPEPAFDPYRFGRPDRPIPPEYAPPGYVPDEPASPYSAAGNAPRSPYGAAAPSGPSRSGQQWPSAPPYGYPGSPRQQRAGNGRAVAGLVLGIVSIVMFWLAFLNIVFLVLGLVFAMLGMRDAKVRNGVGRGMALAGLICTGVGFVVTALYTAWALHVAGKCGGISNSGDTDFSNCIRKHL